MGEKIGICLHCGESFVPNPRVKLQRYCRKKECQRARRTKWQRDKMITDQAYRSNQKRCQKEWQVSHRGYYKQYRQDHPDYAERNKLSQRKRDARRRKNGLVKMLAKMDSLSKTYSRLKDGLFRATPQDDRVLAKMDSFLVKLVPV